MNISQPVASSLDSVEFTILSSEEIQSISVKRIENENTFNTLQAPVPGGLYDPALGAWGDSLCATCNQNQFQCPGHPGHIELPVPVFHPIFMDQAYRLLRAQCVYCWRFRMSRNEVHRYECMLRLLQVGLLHEAQMIDSFNDTGFGKDIRDMAAGDVPGMRAGEAEGDSNLGDSLSRAREAYVRHVLEQHRHNISLGAIRKGKHEGAAEMRRAVIKDFLAKIGVERRCKTCDAISPQYRKDRYVKIFERELSKKDKNAMAGVGQKRIDALGLRRRPKKNQDEAIADVDMSASDEEGEGEDLDEDGNVTKAGTDNQDKSESSRGQRYLPVMEIKERLNLLFHNERGMINALYNSKPRSRTTKPVTADMFFIETLLVPPNRFRPEARMGEGEISENSQNGLYKNIIKAAFDIGQIYRSLNETHKAGGKMSETQRSHSMRSLHESCVKLQDAVNSLIDSTKNPVTGRGAQKNPDGIKQLLEKKEGLFRKNMMGKRVNYAARSVISPDPHIETNEIGVPPVFARKLTFPEPVTGHNFREMQQAVINGPDKWPGAAFIENENGQLINLKFKSAEDRVALANQLLAPTSTAYSGIKNKKVYRHLTNGDVVIMNRQPTLHKPSMMGHRVRVLPGEKTIRMHYANCNTYNADFDGDEMNMHFPQNEVARAEALNIADTDHQYISATAGKPLRGLIQDHLSVSVALCNKDTFFNRGDYMQLIYASLRPENGHIMGERIVLVPPAIMKPTPRWTGKQIITTILKNIRPPGYGDLWMNSKSSVPGRRWGWATEEGEVKFRDGEFICGILDKSQLGPSSGGFIHSIHEIYGPSSAGKLLSSMGRLLTRYLAMIAFSCGMDDLRFTPEGERQRKEKIKEAANIGLEVAAKYVSLDDKNPTNRDPTLLRRIETVTRDDKKLENLDHQMNARSQGLSSQITQLCLPGFLVKQFPKNQMQSMTTSGAKGSQVNANLISCNLGQQVLEGRRVPVMVSGKTLPCFEPFDTDVRSGGYIVSRFLTGIRPQEYYFHHMAGREGLIDTAVKTSRSGYLQRCLIKGMEGLKVAYDGSVRDADGSVVQFLYGEDGVDISKQKFLTDFQFNLHNLESQVSQIGYHEDGMQRLFEHKDDIIKRMKTAIKSKSRRKPIDPVNSELNPAVFGFATSEKFYTQMTEYTSKNADGLVKDKKGGGDKSKENPKAIARKAAEKFFAAKYIKSLVEPGEAVGIVAGQSVGEPSTQMTLNTFHLAGHSAKNVTLGIPRLREILMTASANISTPSMTLVLNEELTAEDGERFAKSISILSLADVIDSATVMEKTGRGISYPAAKLFKIRLDFFKAEEYIKTYAISKEDVLGTVEKKFVPLLLGMVKKEIKKKEKNTGSMPEVGEKSGTIEMARPAPADGAERADDDDDVFEDIEDDASGEKARANRGEAVSYGPNDEEDEAIRQDVNRVFEAEEEVNDFDDEGYGGSTEAEDSGDAGDDERGEDVLVTRDREARVKNKHDSVARFRCDEVDGEWVELQLEYDLSMPKLLMLNIVQEAVKKALIQHIARVGNATFAPDEKIENPVTGETTTAHVVHTEGANLRAMQMYADYINPNRISTNDTVQVLQMYGVEACRSNVVSELGGVFKGHGIGVDPRHLNLIADYMTRGGGYSPFNRIGLTSNVSPFTKMSYETTVSFLKDAVLDNDWDPLTAPSSRIVVGKLNTTGTGSFDLLTNVPTQHYSVDGF